MNEKFNSYREKYTKIIYKSYQVIDESDHIKIMYTFEIPNLTVFNPYITISKEYILNDINNDIFNSIVFRLGLIELISYYKCMCPKIIEIEAGYIDEYEQSWYKKLFYNGLGEFFHINNISISKDKLFDFSIRGGKLEVNRPT